MKSLGAKFSEKQLAEMKNTAEYLDVSISALARAALRLGVEQIDKATYKDVNKAKDLVLINDARAK
jgi:Zn-dependent peptidase ImmA (M78 family)